MTPPLSLIIFALLALISSCSPAQQTASNTPSADVNTVVKTGAERTDVYFDLLEGKRIGLVANQTSTIGDTHLADSLIRAGINLVVVFAPEHGFRGDSGAGETVHDGRDEKTGVRVVSLYGNNKRPSAEMLKDVDILLFDIQDVGARFYTYISTMHYVMDAAAEYGKEVIILDRPNPNGHYIAGPVLEPAFSSFVGMHPIPIVHGLTIGELAKMILGEGWLEHKECSMRVIECKGYTHSYRYHLPVKPSPNLPNMTAVYLYPSLCWFEGTAISVGRGTPYPFQMAGFPGMPAYDLKLTPQDIPHVASDPPYEGKETMFRKAKEGADLAFLDITWLQDIYNAYPDKNTFFTSPNFFDKLAGTDKVRKQLQSGGRLSDLKDQWDKDIQTYKARRKLYLLYPDFE